MVADIITNFLIVVAVTSLLGYLASDALRSKAMKNAATGELTFSYVRPYKALAVISLVIPIFMGALSLHLYRSGESDYFTWLLIFLAFAALSVYLLLECFVARLLVSGEAITSVSPWRGQRTLKWVEVSSISYSKTSRCYTIVGPGGKKIRASEYLSGIGELVAELRKRIPPERWHNSGEGFASIGGRRI